MAAPQPPKDNTEKILFPNNDTQKVVSALAKTHDITLTAEDTAYLAKLNREHLEKTAEIVRRLDAARERLIFPEPENPLEAEGPDGIPSIDPKTGKFCLLEKGDPEYQAYLDEHAEAIRLHQEWETAPANSEYVAIRRELERAQNDYTDRLLSYYEQIKNAPSIGIKPATNYIAPTDLISNRIFSGDISSVPENIRISGIKAKKPVITSVSVDFEAIEGDIAITGRKRLDRYTQSVYQAIIALWNAGNEYMTIGMIYNTMTGNKDAKLTPTQTEMIKDSINSLRCSVVNINASDEHNLKGYGAVEASYSGNLIAAEFATVKVKGKHVDGAIKVFTSPILYRYAAAKKQIATGDITLLNAPINKTPENIVLIDYLRRRVDAMPNPRTENKIKYAAIYDTLKLSGSDNTVKVKKRRIREYIEKTLDYWKERGYIESYTEYYKGDKKYAEGVEITPAENRNLIPQRGERGETSTGI